MRQLKVSAARKLVLLRAAVVSAYKSTASRALLELPFHATYCAAVQERRNANGSSSATHSQTRLRTRRYSGRHRRVWHRADRRLAPEWNAADCGVSIGTTASEC